MAFDLSKLDHEALLAEKQRAEKFINETCDAMRGPMSDLERQLLHADRKEARAHLAKVEKEIEFRI